MKRRMYNTLKIINEMCHLSQTWFVYMRYRCQMRRPPAESTAEIARLKAYISRDILVERRFVNIFEENTRDMDIRILGG